MRDGFTKAEYLELSGKEYINTEFTVSGKSRIVLDCMQLDTSATFCFYCTRTTASGTDKKSNTLFYIKDSGYRTDYYGTSKTTSGYYTTSNSRFIIDNNQGIVKIGSDYTVSMTTLSDKSASALFLGASYVCNTGRTTELNNYAKLRIYSCQIYDDNSTLVRDFVPCLEESSGHIGLYDQVNDLFHRPIGSGNSILQISNPINGNIRINNTFKSLANGYININGSYKPIIESYIFKNEKYTKLDYIQSNGIQKIDTGIKPSDDLVTTVDFQCLSDGITDNCIFGSSWTINGYLFNAYQSGGGLRWHYGGVQKDVSIDATTRITASCSKAGITVNGTSYTFTPTGTNSTNNIYIFSTPDVESIRGAGTETTYNGRYKLYSFKMVKNGVTIRDYIPVKRNSDSMIGLYEQIEGKFYCSDSSIEDKIPYANRSCIETTYSDSDHNTNAKWIYNNSSNYASNAKLSMTSSGLLTGIAEILEAHDASDANKFAKYNYDYGYAEPHHNLLASDCTLSSITITNSSGTEIASSNPTISIDDNHRMHFSITSSALVSAAAGKYTLTITVTRSSVTCKFEIPITKIDTTKRYFSGNDTTNTVNYLRLAKICDNRTITCKGFVAEVLKPTYTVTSKVSGASYGFNLASDGYYTSSNNGVNSSASVCRVNFTNNTGAAYTVTFNCINYAEVNYDYGIIGKINTVLSTSSSADSTYTKSFKGSSSSSVQTVTLSVPTGTSYVDIKYLKDSSQHSNNDSFKFKIVL